MGRLTGKKILFFVEDLYEDLELWYPRIRLKEEGATTVVAGPEKKLYRGKNGYPCRADAPIDEVKSNEFDGLVIPGGYAPDKLRRHQAVLDLTREFHEAGKPIAFICHAGWVPISARIIKGKNVTCVRAIKDDVENAGATYHDKPVVVDGNLISSRTPEDLPEFSRAIIQWLSGD